LAIFLICNTHINMFDEVIHDLWGCLSIFPELTPEIKVTGCCEARFLGLFHAFER
jgi:hypothetical protein